MRRLLLLSIFAKYLEDRRVFPSNWFENFHPGATSFIEVIASFNSVKVSKMLLKLKETVNGDVFDISSDLEVSLTDTSLKAFFYLIDAKGQQQRFLWKQYSFNFIPVEVLSHIY